MATPSNYISVFPQMYVYAISTPHPGIRETYKPIAQSNQIFSYRETEVRMRKNVYFFDSARETSLTTALSLVSNAEYT